MTHRPYPRRGRALRQVEQGRVAPSARPQQTLAQMLAYLKSDEHRQRMRRIGVTAAEALRNAWEGVARMPRLTDFLRAG